MSQVTSAPSVNEQTELKAMQTVKNLNGSMSGCLVVPQPDFKANASIDVSAHVKSLQGLSYLPWGVSLSMLREYNCRLAVGFEENEEGEPYFITERGAYLKPFVFDKVNGQRTPSLFYPVRDNRRKSDPNVGMDTLGNQMQRAVAKVIAQETGLGWSLYSKYDDSIAELEEMTARPAPTNSPAPTTVRQPMTATKKVIAPPANADVLDF